MSGTNRDLTHSMGEKVIKIRAGIKEIEINKNNQTTTKTESKKRSN